jgi:DNA-binding PadR family transcriptional regulator
LVTELEGVVLGIIWGRGPCSGYVVHKRFAQSPTSGWASSTGSIYPALRRLQSQALISCEEGGIGQRGRLFSITPAGEDSLRSWIFAFGGNAGGAAIDPLRARGIYLGVLDGEARQAFMNKAEHQARAALARVTAAEHDSHARENWGHQAALLGVKFEIEARLKWLTELRRREAFAGGDGHLQDLAHKEAPAAT